MNATQHGYQWFSRAIQLGSRVLSWIAPLHRRWSHAAGRPLLAGTLLALILLVALSRYMLFLGFESVVVAPLLGVAGMVFSLAQWWGPASHNRPAQAAQWVILGVAALLVPWILEIGGSWLTRLNWIQLSSSGTVVTVLACWSLLAFGPLLYIVGRILWGQDRAANEGGWLLAGFLITWLIAPLTVVAWWGTSLVGFAAIGGAFLMAIWEWYGSSEPGQSVSPAVQSDDYLSLVLTGLVGLLLPTVFHIGHQYVPASLFSLTSLWGGILLGVGFAGWWRPVRQSAVTRLLVCGLTCTMLLALAPALTGAHLRLSTYLSSMWLLFSARMALLAAFTVPCGWLIGDTVFPARHNGDKSGLSLLWLTCGGLFGFTVPWSPSTLLTLCGLMCIVASVLIGLPACRRSDAWRTQRWKTILVASLWLVAVAGLCRMSNYQPAEAERLIFSPQAFYSLRNGTSAEWLPHLDDRRLISQTATVNGRWSVSRFRANQYEIRHNGLMLALSASPNVTGPLSPTEVMPVALPLSIAVQAEHMLLLGLSGPTMVETALEYPLKSVTVLESDTAAVTLAQDLDRQFGVHAFRDDRVNIVTTPTTLAMHGTAPQQYDVIVASSSQVARIAMQSTFSTEFYRGVLRQLKDDGLFCQRLAYFDLGPDLMRDVAASLQTVFPQVTILETSPGEILFLATRTPREFVDSELIDQLQRSHSRRVFSRVGWDWSVATRLSFVSSDALSAMCAAGRANSAFDSRIPWQLPQEISRWGDKASRTRALLASHAESFGSGLGEVPEAQDIVHRLEDVQQKYVSMVQHPDQYWGYRRVLKDRLKDRPRTEIVQVKHEGLKRTLHSEDARRKDYLQTLGDIAKADHLTAPQIEQLTQFCQPYDPLITDFAHYEAAHLYARATQGDPRTAYDHWLHCVLYAPPEDRSVRTICAALHMLCQYPECVATPADRWDHINGLLEEMERRWSLRLTAAERSRYEPVDTNRCIEAVQAALRTLDESAAAVPVAPDDWALRKAVIEDSLLRPLRAERSLQSAVMQLPSAVQ